MTDAHISGLKLDPGLQRRRITSDYIADSLRDAIQDGSLPDGAVLNQVAIAERFGVSRVPVREAMRQLQAEGLISAQAHRQAVVQALSVDRIAEIYEIRALLEGYLIEKAVVDIDQATLRRAREIHRGMRGVEDHDKWLARNTELHRVLYEPSRSPVATEMAATLRSRAQRYVNLWTGGRGIERNAEAGREHERILRLVAKGDAAGARRAVESHILHTRDGLLARYEDRPRDGTPEDGHG